MKVGLLYDSISDNSGDEAIGIALAEYCKKEGFPYEIINPFNFDPREYTSIIIGGGFLLREPGDPFYDVFRLKGKYILNGVGVAAQSDLDYLNEYDYVSVRSQREKQMLVDASVDHVDVVPCITTNMEGSDISNIVPRFTKRTIGIHIVADTLANNPFLLDTIYQLPHDKVFIPFTHYNEDRSLMGALPGIENHMLLQELDPKQLFSVIGKMEMVITSSLHASVFAYLQNIPFLTFYQQKTFDYFKDRGLEWHVCKDLDDFKDKISIIFQRKIDFSPQIERDKTAIKKHLEKITQIIKNNSQQKNQAKGRPLVVKNEKWDENDLMIDQLHHVILSRDVLIKKLYAELYSDKDNPATSIRTRYSELVSKNHELEKIIAAYQQRIDVRLGAVVKKIYHRLIK